MERRCARSDVSRSPLSRRQLLKGGLALAACAWTFRPDSILAEEPPVESLRVERPAYEPDWTRWALLSDTHIAADPEDRYRGFYPYRNLQEVTAQIAYNPPEGVVITGDLARLKGESSAYVNLKTLLAPVARRPIHLGLGNHDDRENFFRTFGDGCDAAGVVENKHVITAQTGPVRLIVLDTLLNVNALSGKLGAQQRTWLQTVLRMHDDTPTILFLHHTPNFELLDRHRLFEIIKPIGKIKAVVYGHSHQYEYSQSAGIHLINLPATGFALSDRQPVGWVEAKLTRQGGEFTLHALGGNRKLDGHITPLRWRS
jgi:3',5'-cyclic-AMP phosphodiesterase